MQSVFAGGEAQCQGEPCTLWISAIHALTEKKTDRQKWQPYSDVEEEYNVSLPNPAMEPLYI